MLLDVLRYAFISLYICISVSICSGVYFQGTTIGMAPIMSMCTAEQSGGIVMVSDISVICETKFMCIVKTFSQFSRNFLIL